MDQGKKKLLIKARKSNTAEQDLIEQIRIGTGHNFEARLDQGGKPYPSLANMGAKKHQLAQMTREGEYHGITIKLLEPIYPSLTNLLIIKLLNHIEKHEEQIAINMIDPRFVKYGIEGLHYIVSTWLKRQQFNIPNFIQSTKVQDPELDRYISREYHSPIDVPFTLISPGFNESMGSSVVPEEWIDRNFIDAQQFHNEMDQLPWRIGKPPVTYCLTYSLNVIDEVSWSQGQVKGQLIIIDDNMHTQYVDSKTFDNSQFKYDILRINNKDSPQLHIGIHKDQFFNDVPVYPSNERVSLLASRMQKCIRRGRQCSQVLADTIKELIQCKSYTLPDMKMARVSASRQLLWRLYISTIEDSLVYLPTEGYLDLFTMAALALICQNDTSLQLNQKIINIILHTALAIQSMDGQDDIWEWRIDKQKNMIGSTKINKDQVPTNLLESLKISMNYQPMMGGDKVMLGNYQIICELLAKQLQCPYKVKVTKLDQKPISGNQLQSLLQQTRISRQPFHQSMQVLWFSEVHSSQMPIIMDQLYHEDENAKWRFIVLLEKYEVRALQNNLQKFKSLVYNLCNISKPKEPYLILQINHSDKNKEQGLYIIELKNRNSIKIGRTQDCDIKMHDISVSRHHASIIVNHAEQSFYVEDNCSKFGTLVQASAEDLQLVLNSSKRVALQVGRVVIVLSIDKKNNNKKFTKYRVPHQFEVFRQIKFEDEDEVQQVEIPDVEDILINDPNFDYELEFKSGKNYNFLTGSIIQKDANSIVQRDGNSSVIQQG